MPLSIEVLDGQIISMVDNQGKPVTDAKETLDQYASVDKLFGILDTAINGGADKVTAEYNADYGYPTSISIDYVEQAADDEISFDVSNFEVLK